MFPHRGPRCISSYPVTPQAELLFHDFHNELAPIATITRKCVLNGSIVLIEGDGLEVVDGIPILFNIKQFGLLRPRDHDLNGPHDAPDPCSVFLPENAVE